MSDAKLRELERRFRETEDLLDEVRYLRERLKRGKGAPPLDPLEQAFGLWFLLLQSGVPVVDGLERVQQQAPPELAAQVGGVLEDVRGGASLALSFARRLRGVPPAATVLVDHGEVTGALDQQQGSILLSLRLASRGVASDARDLHLFACLLRARVGFGGGSSALRGWVDGGVPERVRTLLAAVVERGLAAKNDAFGPALLRDLLPGCLGSDAGSALFEQVLDAHLSGLLELPGEGMVQVSLRRDLVRLFFLLNVGFTGGLPALPALAGLLPWLGRPEVRTAAQAVHDGVAAGGMIHEELERHDAFPPPVVDLIRRAERAGSLERACRSIVRGLTEGWIQA